MQAKYFLKLHRRQCGGFVYNLWRLTISQKPYLYRWLSRVSLHWLGAFLDVGFSRPLEKDGMWFIFFAGLDRHHGN